MLFELTSESIWFIIFPLSALACALCVAIDLYKLRLESVIAHGAFQGAGMFST